jgi:hypothetical protein
MKLLFNIAIDPEEAAVPPDIGPYEYVFLDRSMVTFQSVLIDGESPGWPTYEFTWAAGGGVGNPTSGGALLPPQPLAEVRVIRSKAAGILAARKDFIEEHFCLMNFCRVGGFWQ